MASQQYSAVELADLPPQPQWEPTTKDPTSKRWLLRRSTQRILTELSDTGKDIKTAYGNTNKKLFRTHAFAAFLAIVFGVLPLAVFFSHEPNPWVSMAVSCQGSTSYFGRDDESANGDPALGIFVIDALLGQMPFSTAKFVDILWDLLIGRGAQAIAWFASYVVFTKSLIRTIELSPTPFTTFAGVTIDGSSVMTVYTLIKDITRHRGKRVTAIFVYMTVSCLWILSLPTILSAMTGYVSSNQSYLRLPNQQLMDYSELKEGVIIYDGERVGKPNGTCSTETSALSEMGIWGNAIEDRCPCQLPNGTIVESREWLMTQLAGVTTALDCGNQFNLTTNATFAPYSYPKAPKNNSCMTNFTVTLDGKDHDLGRLPLNISYGFCFGGDGNGLVNGDVYSNTVCLPSNDDSKYEWGFSRMLTAIFVMIQFVWAITMYLLWLDAMIFSKLVRAGMTLSQLRGAFAVTAAAEDRLNMTSDELITVSKEKMKHLEEKGSVVEVRHLEKGKEAASRRSSHHSEED